MTHPRDRAGAEGAGPTGIAHATRRRGARRNVAKRIRLVFKGRALEAWVLNVSRGGLRLLLESPLAAGDEFEAHVPAGEEFDGEPQRRPVRVVWADRQADGTIAGVEFLDVRPSVRMPVARDLSLEADEHAGPASTPGRAPAGATVPPPRPSDPPSAPPRSAEAPASPPRPSDAASSRRPSDLPTAPPPSPAATTAPPPPSEAPTVPPAAAASTAPPPPDPASGRQA